MTLKVRKDIPQSLLEWELNLEFSDLRSHAWYHGLLSRSKAESLMRLEGDFLVRNATSNPEKFVVTCYSKNQLILHFIINKYVLYPNTAYENIRYAFDDDWFDTIPDLITYYVGNKRAVSLLHGAIISRPVNRLLPLSICSPSLLNLNLANHSLHFSLLSKQQRHQQVSLCPPPKPARDIHVLTSSQFDQIKDNKTNQDQSQFSDDGAFCLTSLCQVNQEFTKNGKKKSLTLPFTITSSIDLVHFKTLLLPKESRPFNLCATQKIKSVLLNNSARFIANHITKCDLDFLKLDTKGDLTFTWLVGLELILLPQGAQYRNDIMDRFKCFTYLVQVSILSCSELKERSSLLDKWIQVAMESKTGLGNLMAFGAIILALLSPPIERLKDTWIHLRHHFTSNALTFENNSKPTLKNLIQSREPQAPNTTVPFVLTSVEIIQKHYQLMNQIESNSEDMANFFKNLRLNLSLEENAEDYGLEAISSHLEECRTLVDRIRFYQKNAQLILKDVIFEELVEDMFRTEFHRCYLWGSRSAQLEAQIRYDEMDKILHMRSIKCES